MSVLVVKAYRALDASDEEQGKFVLLSKAGGLHLVLSPVSLTAFHANIVYQYLQVEGRGAVENAGESGCHILSRDWIVQGGGHYHAQKWLHHLRLHGKSTAFGKYQAALLVPHLDQVTGLLGLEGYTLDME